MNQERALLSSPRDASAAIRWFAHFGLDWRSHSRRPCFQNEQPVPGRPMILKQSKGTQVRVSFGPELSKTPLDGRLLVMLSTDPKDEPRFQINESPKTQQIFGIDVDGLRPGQEAVDRRDGPGLSAREPAPGSRRAITGSRPCCTGTRRFTAATGTSSSCRWTAARGSSGTRRPATSTARPRK